MKKTLKTLSREEKIQKRIKIKFLEKKTTVFIVFKMNWMELIAD